jgi:P22 coat protein - gene protein 5
MANTILTPAMITNKAVIRLENLLNFGKYVDRQYSNQFARQGAKIGATLNIRKPARFQGRTGPALQVEDFNETYVPLVITNQFGVDVSFTSAEEALSLNDLDEQVIGPGMATVANRVDNDGLTQYLNIGNLVGTPGTPPNALDFALQVRQRLLDEGFPDDGQLYLLVGPQANRSLVAGNSTLFNPQREIGKQYREGIMADIAGLQIAVDQNVGAQTVGPLGGSPVVNGANQGVNSGWSDSMNLVTNAWTASAAPRLNQGDVFTIAGVFKVNPQSRKTTNVLQQFTTLANVSSDGAGNATIPIAPAIIFLGQHQNVTASPANGAALTVVGTASTTYVQNLGFHKSAFTLATVDLLLPRGVHMASRKVYKNFSLRMVQAYDVNNDRLPMRLDCLYGYKTIYREGGVRLTN